MSLSLTFFSWSSPSRSEGLRLFHTAKESTEEPEWDKAKKRELENQIETIKHTSKIKLTQ